MDTVEGIINIGKKFLGKNLLSEYDWEPVILYQIINKDKKDG